MSTLKPLKILHYFIGVSAVFGGLAGILNPYGFGQLTTEVLVNGPFRTFLVPGLFLLLFLGFGNFFAGWVTRKNLGIQGYISGFFASGLVLWIVIQCYVMQTVNVLHGLFFVLGGVQGILSILLLARDRPFPFRKL